MHQNDPHREADLSDLERRLGDWRPTEAGLQADAMLFAAGLAAGRRGRGRLLWPVVCVLLALQTAGLGVWALSERAERQALADRLHEQAPAPQAPAPTVVAVSVPFYTPSPNDYYQLRRTMEQDPNAWLSAAPAATQSPVPPPPEPVILKAGERDGLLGP
jgi:hypothetical protein